MNFNPQFVTIAPAWKAPCAITCGNYMSLHQLTGINCPLLVALAKL